MRATDQKSVELQESKLSQCIKSLSNSSLTTANHLVRTADVKETEQKIYGVETKVQFFVLHWLFY